MDKAPARFSRCCRLCVCRSCTSISVERVCRACMLIITSRLTMPDCNCSPGTVNVSPLAVEYASESVEQLAEQNQAYLCRGAKRQQQ